MTTISVSTEVRDTLTSNGAVVALESTIFSNLGLPSPANAQALSSCIAAIRKAGAVPAITAVIGEMRRINAPVLAHDKGEYLAEQLTKVASVVDVRGQGLLRAVELGPKRDAKAVYLELLNRGVVTNAVNATSLRLAPPITVSIAEMDEVIAAIAQVLAEGVGVIA